MYFDDFSKIYYPISYNYNGSIAKVSCNIKNGKINNVLVDDFGDGYDFIDIKVQSPELKLNNYTAILKGIIRNGKLYDIKILNHGNGYTFVPKIYVSVPAVEKIYKTKLLTDISFNYNLPNRIISNNFYNNYIIEDNETPDIISTLIYGTPKYNWAILLANNITNYLIEFPKSAIVFNDYLNDKYGTNRKSIRFYELKNGMVVSQNYSGATSVTNEEYETRINDKKRYIKIIPKELMSIVK